MKKLIQLHTKQQFEEVMKLYDKDWKVWMWDTFRNETCYIPEENCFISLSKAIEMGNYKISI